MRVLLFAFVALFAMPAISQPVARGQGTLCSQWNGFSVTLFSSGCDAGLVPEISDYSSSIQLPVSDGYVVSNDDDASGGDTTASGDTITYDISSNPFGRYLINSSTGETTVPTASLLVAGSDSIVKSASSNYGSASYTQTATVLAEAGGGNTAPVITITGAQTVYVTEGTSYVDAGATATDSEDGDLTGSIVTTSNVNINTIGNYTVTYDVTDSGSLSDQATRDVVVIDAGASNGDINSDIQVTTRRLTGVSPEVVSFDASASTCSDCISIFGIQTTESIAWGELAYAFDFDDSDSGSFATTGNSRNTQTGSSPLAAHTFHCYGETDPNWDATDEICRFDVGVRVQSKDGDFDDAYVTVDIAPLVGVGGAYDPSDVTCVSAFSNFSDCLAYVPGAATATDFPNANAFGSRLYIVANDDATYADACPDAEQKNAVVIAYGPNLNPSFAEGNRPYVGTIMAGSRVGETTNCFHTQTTSTVVTLQSSFPSRDANGDINNGWGFGQKFVGLETGRTRNGMSTQFTHFIDLEQDQYSGSSTGEFNLATAGNFCIPQNNNGATVQCSDLPYQSMMMVADSVLIGNCDGTPAVEVMSSFAAGVVENAFIGVDIGCADQHIIRINGSYKTIVSNMYLRGNAGIPVTGSTARGSGITQRPIASSGGEGTGGNHNQFADPTVFTGTAFMRTGVEGTEYWNKYNVFIDSIFNDPVQHASAQNGFPLGFGGWYSLAYGNTFNAITSGDIGLQDMRIFGRFVTVRNTTYSGNSANMSEETWYTGTEADCSADSYHCRSDIHLEGTPSGSLFTNNTPLLSVPNANWRP